LAPDGEVMNAGISYAELLNENDEDEGEEESDEPDLIYQFYQSLIPFLYYTNKLEKHLHLDIDTYRNMGKFEVFT
jgi:hypothetical protein